MLTNNFIKSFTNFVTKKNLMSTEDIRKIEYDKKVFLYEIIKFLLLILLFTFIGQLDKFIFTFILLTSIGVFSGGLCFYNNVYSFIFSTVFFIFAIVILPTIPFINNLYFYFVICHLCIIIIYYFSPITSKYRPVTSIKYIETAKIHALVVTIFWIVLLYTYFYNSDFFKIGVWTLVLHCLQLLISGTIINRDKPY